MEAKARNRIMKEITISNVRIIKGKGTPKFHIPQAMYGNQFAKFKLDHKEEIDEFLERK